MYNRFEYIERKSKELSNLLNLCYSVKIDRNTNLITVKFKIFEDISIWYTPIKTIFQNQHQDKQYIDRHLKNAAFFLAERKYDANS